MTTSIPPHHTTGGRGGTIGGEGGSLRSCNIYIYIAAAVAAVAALVAVVAVVTVVAVVAVVVVVVVVVGVVVVVVVVVVVLVLVLGRSVAVVVLLLNTMTCFLSFYTTPAQSKQISIYIHNMYVGMQRVPCPVLPAPHPHGMAPSKFSLVSKPPQ